MDLHSKLFIAMRYFLIGRNMHNNIQSMSGVFSDAKQQSYIEETEQYILPMLKTARRRFTTQEPAYMNIKMTLQNQIHLIKFSLQARNA